MQKLHELVDLAPKAPAASCSTSPRIVSPALSDAISLLFLNLQVHGGERAQADLTKKLFVEALHDLSESLTLAVLFEYRTGRLGHGYWCPKPGEIRQEVRRRQEAEARRAETQRLADEQLAHRRRRQQHWAAIAQNGEAARVAKLCEEFRRGCPSVQERRREDWLGSDEECVTMIEEKRAGRWPGRGVEPHCSEEMLKILRDVAAKKAE